MNKVLPIILIVVVGLGIVAGAFFFFNRSNNQNVPQEEEEVEEEVARELPLEEKPYVTLTPRADGHEFHLTIEKVPQGVGMVEYELVYKNEDGVTQGVPGSIKYNKESLIERDLLLGSCSSGKCKYDEGVEDGTFTLRLRDANGKLITKMETGFHLQRNEVSLTSSDSKFTYTLANKNMATGYYLTMGTFGIPENAPATVENGPYGVFTRSTSKVNGTVTLGTNIYIYTGGSWTKLDSGKASTLGVFVSTSQ